MSAKEEFEKMQKVLLSMSRLAKRRAKKYGVDLVYELDGKIISEKIAKTPSKK
jgi:Skp family chaperone for outer membrane proteins